MESVMAIISQAIACFYKKMAYESFDKKSKLADDELDIINENNSINDKHKYLKLRYLENNYFSKSEKIMEIYIGPA